jgi:hypothetical protein
VTLAVVDETGLTDSTTELVSIRPFLSIQGASRNRARSEFRVDLRWIGADGNQVELERNFVRVGLVANDGRHRDVIRGEGTFFTWRVCEVPGGQCSNTVSIDFGPDPEAAQATLETELDRETIVETLTVDDE